MVEDTEVSVRNFIFSIKLTKPRGPILGARDEVAPTSPPTHRRNTGMKNINNLAIFFQG